MVILPEHGGRVHQLYLNLDGREEPILWSPEDPAAYGEHPTHGGCFPMAPWPNRIAGGRFTWRGEHFEVPLDGKPNAIHGRVTNVPWQVVARTGRVVELAAEFDEGWPWAGRAWQRIEITDRALRLKMEVRAERDEFPAGCGWHPWFRRDAFDCNPTAIAVTLDAAEVYVAEAGIPTGEVLTPTGDYELSNATELGTRRIDACYRSITWPVTIDWGPARLQIAAAGPDAHVMLYTPEEAVCIEPQTCAPDAFNLAAREVANSGIAIASPGRAVGFESRWVWEF